MWNYPEPTSYAPIIRKAIDIVREKKGQYHILVIISSGQISRSEDLSPTEMSPQEKSTVDAIVAARFDFMKHFKTLRLLKNISFSSNFPLSIVLVGVGDGPWEVMKALDDFIPTRKFDNLQVF